MKHSLYFTIFLLVTTHLTYGQGLDSNCLKLNLNKLTKSVRNNNFNFSSIIKEQDKHRKSLTVFFNSINKIIDDHLEIPTSQTIDIIPDSKSAHFLKEENHLELPLEITIKSGKLDALGYESMLAHEYGHAIFHKNLASADPQYLINIEKIKESKALKEKLMKLEDSGLKKQSKEKEKLKARIEKLSQETRISELDSLFTGAYHELFADLIAIIKMKDPESMKKLVAKTTEGKKGDHRSFTNTLSPKGWTHQTPHYVFSPTRSFIGQNLLPGLDKNKEGELIRKIFDAIVTQVKETREKLLNQYQLDPTKEIHEYKFDVEAMNIDLINLLKQIET